MTNRDTNAGQNMPGKEGEGFFETKQALPPWITILGVDGAGKSSVLERLPDAAFFGFKGIRIFHRRPAVVYPRPPEMTYVISHYLKPPHGPVKSVLKLFVMVLDWLAGYYLQIRKWRSQGNLVIADRHSLLDLLVDPLRYRYGGPRRLVEILLPLTPQPDLILLLDAPVEVLQARKSELTTGQAQQLRTGYLQLSRSLPGFRVIDSTRPIEEVCTEVVEAIQSLLPLKRQQVKDKFLSKPLPAGSISNTQDSLLSRKG